MIQFPWSCNIKYGYSYTYDAIGNLTSKAGVGLGYPDSGTSSVRPHAVITTSSGSAFSYDANGNMTQRVAVSGTQVITYQQAFNAENRLAVVTNTLSGAVTRFTYDGDGARVKREDLATGAKIIYVGQLYEKSFSLQHWTFSGRVLSGTQSLAGAVVKLKHKVGSSWIEVDSQTTGANGVFNLSYSGYETSDRGFRLVETDPFGYVSVSASSRHLAVVGDNLLERTSLAPGAYADNVFGDEERPVGTWTFTGQVVEEFTSAGVAGANVRLDHYEDSSWVQKDSQTTGSSGTFSLEYTGMDLGNEDFRLVKTNSPTCDWSIDATSPDLTKISNDELRGTDLVTGTYANNVFTVRCMDVRDVAPDQHWAVTRPAGLATLSAPILLGVVRNTVSPADQNPSGGRSEDRIPVAPPAAVPAVERTTALYYQGSVIGEVGYINDTLTHITQTIVLNQSYVDPVVIAQPVSLDGGDHSVIRITNVLTDRFTLYVHEAPNKDGTHGTEAVSYLVLEAGTWTLADGTRVAAGKLHTDATVGNRVSNQWAEVWFPHAFADIPVVLSQAQTNDDPHWVKTRQDDITPQGFAVALEEEEAKTTAHGVETVGWVALEARMGTWSGHLYEARATADEVTHVWWTTLDFAQAFTTPPRFLAALASYDDPDNSHVRYNRTTITTDTVQVRVEEDNTYDAETAHTSEVVHYLAVQGDGTLQAAATQALEIETSYYFFGAKRVAMRKNSTLTYLHADHLGSTSLATDEDGEVMARQLYYPYGETRYITGTLPTDYGFTGQRSDAYSAPCKL